MALSGGTRLGPYEIVALLGAGGMGDVYRARDTRLNRDVAIKVLPDLFAGDGERFARFTREAQTLAALNHPNIAHVHGLEESGPVRALVMEIVEGDDLSAILARGPLPVADVLPIARQIAGALEAAHELDIVHRDLKPANIKVRPDGTVKVLDFGLAKALQPPGASGAVDAANSPTFTGQVRINAAFDSPATMMGTIIGTAAYMSPEQARGKAVDNRADIWAYGVVLYEMLTGRPAFAGDNVTDILAAVVSADPDWTALPPGTPPSIRRLLRRCLAKDLNARLPDIRVARLEIADASAPAEGIPVATSRHPPTRFAWIGALLLGAAATALGGWWLTPGPSAIRPVHLTLPMPPSERWIGNNGSGIAISPDGAWIAYLALANGRPPQVFVRALDQDATRSIPESEGATAPFFSPDSRQLGFTRQGKIWRVPVTGGTAFEVGTIDPADRGLAWGSDGYIYSGGGRGLSRIAASGGARESLTTVNTASGEVAHRFPAVVPGQDAVVFTVFKGSLAESRLGVLDIASRKWTVLFYSQAHSPAVLPSGHLLFLRGPDLMMVPFDLARRTVTGTPEPALSRVMFNNGGAGQCAVSDIGTLTYLSEDDNRPQTMASWAWRGGRTERIGLPEGTYTDAVMSADGSRLAMLVRERSNQSYMAIWDVARASFAARLSGDGLRESPIWSPDDTAVIFTYREQGVGSIGRLFRQRADGTAPPEPLTTDVPTQTHGGSGQYPGSVSKDGQLFFAQMVSPTDGLGVLNLQSRASELIVKGEVVFDPQISPDGRWLAYTGTPSRNAAPPITYLRPYPDVNWARWTLSANGGFFPRWSRDGRNLFYLKGQQILAVSMQGVRDVPAAAAKPTVVLTSSAPIVGFDVHPDGERFLLLQVQQDARPAPRVILNWLQTRGSAGAGSGNTR